MEEKYNTRGIALKAFAECWVDGVSRLRGILVSFVHVHHKPVAKASRLKCKPGYVRHATIKP